MFKWIKPALVSAAVLLAVSGTATPVLAEGFPGVGRAAQPDEIKAWDIDVRPDFKGLPRGQGTVDEGMEVWETACASCHGSFGESNSVFTPLVGGTTAKDIETGRVASLTSPTQPARTTLMKVPTVSTLWDYIHRAMPWDNPKSLSPDEVYAVLAYLLNLAEIVPMDYTLSDQNIAEVQGRMPNRNGMIFWEGMWKVDGEPDVKNTACMSDCKVSAEPSSTLPDFARDAHGDLAAQMRVIGPVRGVNTMQPALTGTVADNAQAVREYARATLKEDSPAAGESQAAAAPASADADKAMSLLQANGCMACHARDKKILGPSFVDISQKYQGQEGIIETLTKKLKSGGGGVWGPVPMPANPNLNDDDAKVMLEWILAGAN